MSEAAAPSPSLPAADAPPAVEVSGLSISYRVRIRSGSFVADARRMLSRSQRDRIVPALRDVSFTVAPGATMAVIGRNGAGKSTLLRALAGVLTPDAGRIVARGRLTLLAVGVGFQPRLTGRENIRLGGLAAGLPSDRIEELTAPIAEFAQLAEYLDFPMETYSTGMRQRLGFAITAHLDPEILLIDEALGGGDVAFRARADEKMAELMGEGRTIVLVTHGLSTVRSSATDAIWLHQGKVAAAGDPDDIVAEYLRFCRLQDLDLQKDP